VSTSTTMHSAADDNSSTTCPRCGQRQETAAFEEIDLDWARARDPHVEVYHYRSSPNGDGRRAIAICAVCSKGLDDIAAEMDDYRARLRRRWPLPPAWGSLQDDQRLSHAFERFRDSVPAIYHALSWAIRCQRRGATAYLTVYETGDWSIDSVPVDQGYDLLDDRTRIWVPIPVSPSAALATAEDLEQPNLDALYTRCIPTAAAHDPLEAELARRFYQALYRDDKGIA